MSCGFASAAVLAPRNSIRKASAATEPDSNMRNRHYATILNMAASQAFRFQQNRCYDRAAIQHTTFLVEIRLRIPELIL